MLAKKKTGVPPSGISSSLRRPGPPARIMAAVQAESMVGGTIFHRKMISREISRVLVLNLSGKRGGSKNRRGEVCP